MTKRTKIFSEYIEYGALEQFREAMEQDFVVQGALMPDAHLGYSLPIGAVVATKGVIVPAWVGYDIGCGMCAVKLNLTKEALEGREGEGEIMTCIYNQIPVGNNKHLLPDMCFTESLTKKGQEIAAERNASFQIGTLGGGNHFIEIGYDEEENVWIIIHSGSRGTGHGIAGHYMKIAAGSTKAKEGHYALEENSEQGKNYIQDLNWCLDYALTNRKLMIYAVQYIIEDIMNLAPLKQELFINRNHNHAEKRDGLWIHRKGATHAEKGMLGVIPGNMRDGSFIVKGKGNPDALFSSSHGAGRVLGRRAAKEQLSVKKFEDQMLGITAKVGFNTLDESPDAYKDIFQVMRDQDDLVDIIAHVKPLINIKG